MVLLFELAYPQRRNSRFLPSALIIILSLRRDAFLEIPWRPESTVFPARSGLRGPSLSSPISPALGQRFFLFLLWSS